MIISLTRAKFNCMAAMQGSHLSYSSLYQHHSRKEGSVDFNRGSRHRSRSLLDVLFFTPGCYHSSIRVNVENDKHANNWSFLSGTYTARTVYLDTFYKVFKMTCRPKQHKSLWRMFNKFILSEWCSDIEIEEDWGHWDWGRVTTTRFCTKADPTNGIISHQIRSSWSSFWW